MIKKDNLKKSLKSFAKDLGASLFGVASLDRFEGAPGGHHPGDWLPTARSVISFGIQIPTRIIGYEHLLRNSPWIQGELRKEVLQDHYYGTLGYTVINRNLEEIGLRLTLKLEDMGYGSTYFASTYSEAQKHIQERIPNRVGLISQRHVAVRAGLGEFGLNNIVVTPQVGSRVRFNTVITEAELEPDPLLREKACLGRDCNLCVKHCGGKALKVNEEVDWETVWLDPVSRTDQMLCREKRKKMFCYGRCARICPINLPHSLQWKGGAEAFSAH
jgi:epoxyqueuosine reductase